MNKVYFMSFVLAAALPAMATEDRYEPFLEGVKTVDAAGVPTAEGGDWTTNSVSLANNGDKVEFEASSSPLKLSNFTPGPADTNTIVRVELEASVADVGELMATLPEGAQTAFAVCTNAYHAWNGTDWVVLGDTIAEVGDDSQTTNLTVEISYLGSNSTVRARMARFTIGDTTLVARGASTDLERAGWVALATPANNFTGFGASGSGLLSKVDAEVMLGVAEYAGVKYGTISNAVEVANSQIGVFEAEVEVIRETDEDITSYLADEKNSVHINTAADVAVTVSPTGAAEPSGGEALGESGKYTATVNRTVLEKVGTANIKITLPASMSETKEVDPNAEKTVDTTDGTVTFGVRTASSVLEAASPGPNGGKPLTANVEKLHEFLANNASAAYTAKYDDASGAASAIKLALEADGGNGIPKYQSYALGINQDTPVKPVTIANDADPGAITLSIPALNSSTPSGDYTTIKYVMTKPDSTTEEFEKGANIEVPLSTGSYQVKIVME